MQELIPTFVLADADKARGCRALQTLRDCERAALPREAFGVRCIPPLLTSMWCQNVRGTLQLRPFFCMSPKSLFEKWI